MCLHAPLQGKVPRYLVSKYTHGLHSGFVNRAGRIEFSLPVT